jgi:hypothetical protein
MMYAANELEIEAKWTAFFHRWRLKCGADGYSRTQPHGKALDRQDSRLFGVFHALILVLAIPCRVCLFWKNVRSGWPGAEGRAPHP